MKGFSALVVVACVAIVTGCTTVAPFADPRQAGAVAGRAAMDPGCTSTTLVSTGGPFPHDAKTLVLRWTGFANFEMVYGGKVVLLDAYIDRGSYFPPLGFKAADVKRADLILIGHGHTDHMSDAASIGARTGATVVGAPVTTEKLLAQGVDSNKVRTVTGRGGELLRFPGFTVEPILGRHGEPPPQVVKAFRGALGRLPRRRRRSSRRRSPRSASAASSATRAWSRKGRSPISSRSTTASASTCATAAGVSPTTRKLSWSG